MPVFTFVCPQQHRIAGAIEAIQIRGPFVHPMRRPNGSQVYAPDVQAAWAWLTQTAFNPPLAFPPQVPFAPAQVDPMYNPQTDAQPSIVGIKYTQPPTVQRTQINAPTLNPTGNSGVMTPPPQMPPPGMRTPSDWEELPDSALPRTADPMLGDLDPEGGTYTDISGTGAGAQEVQREYKVPFPLKR